MEAWLALHHVLNTKRRTWRSETGLWLQKHELEPSNHQEKLKVRLKHSSNPQ